MFQILRRKVKEEQEGLTLVELLAVVVILAIVATIAFIMISNVIENSKKDAHIANAKQILAATKLAEASRDIEFTDSNNYTIEVIDNAQANLSTIIPVVVDPWDKNPYDSAIIKKESNNEYLITLSNGRNDCEITNRFEADLFSGRNSACTGSNNP